MHESLTSSTVASLSDLYYIQCKTIFMTPEGNCAHEAVSSHSPLLPSVPGKRRSAFRHGALPVVYISWKWDRTTSDLFMTAFTQCGGWEACLCHSLQKDFLPSDGWRRWHRVDMPQVFYLSMHWWSLACFYLSATVKGAATIVCVQALESLFSALLGIYSGVGFLDHTVVYI